MRVRAAKLLLLVGAAILVGCSSSRRIDGTSAATFERSVAMLQNDLPPRRRDDFDVALAVVWMRATGQDAGDFDGDGDADYFDVRAMADNAGDLLAAIQRGDLVAAIEDGEREAAVAAYFKQLDGLGYDGVVELAGAAGPYVADMKRQVSRAGCDGRGERPPLGYTSRIRKCD